MWQTIGQPEAQTLLKSSLKKGNLAHAYLFVGPQHVGKTTLAIDLARALNCQNIDPPCGECNSCLRVIDGKHADVVLVDLNQGRSPGDNTRTKISIDDIRELERHASLSPYEGKFKVFIINDVENLSDEAANCFLKTLEEPPSGVIFLLLTSDESKLLPTLVSRCQRIELKPIPYRDIEKILIESRGIDEKSARFLARLSGGCLGWALTVSVDESPLQKRAQKLSELFPLLRANWEERFAYASQIENDRKAVKELICLWITWWHDVMLVKCNCVEAITNIDYIDLLHEWARLLDLADIKNFIHRLEESLKNISKNANLHLLIDVLMLDMPRRRDKLGTG